MVLLDLTCMSQLLRVHAICCRQLAGEPPKQEQCFSQAQTCLLHPASAATALGNNRNKTLQDLGAMGVEHCEMQSICC